MKYYAEDQNENWLEAPSAQSCKMAIMWSKKIYHLVLPAAMLQARLLTRCDISDAIFSKMNRIVVSRTRVSVMPLLDDFIQLWILHLGDALTDSSRAGGQKVEGSGNHYKEHYKESYYKE